MTGLCPLLMVDFEARKGKIFMAFSELSAERSMVEAKWKISSVTEPLLNWYHLSARTMPWRSEPSPYRVWLSEIMLQQTRVEAVIPYFLRFVRAIPDISALAAASEEQLHKLWEGLGYYSRVRNLQKAAKQIMERYDGALPPSYELLLDLCGIGPYTAGAIASIAFGIPVPAVDGNVLRVLSRIFASEADIGAATVKKEYQELLYRTMPQDKPGDFNQALMELGATVCLPNGKPKCEDCPIAFGCLGYQQGNPTLYPVKAEKKPRRTELKTVLVLCTPQGVLMHKRPSSGLLAGLWEFPNLNGHLTKQEVKDYLKSRGIQEKSIEPLKPTKHIFTHIEWQMTGYYITSAEIRPASDEAISGITELEQTYTVPNAFAAYKKVLSERMKKKH